jgi:hypothetical protein
MFNKSIFNWVTKLASSKKSAQGFANDITDYEISCNRINLSLFSIETYSSPIGLPC